MSDTRTTVNEHFAALRKRGTPDDLDKVRHAARFWERIYEVAIAKGESPLLAAQAADAATQQWCLRDFHVSY